MKETKNYKLLKPEQTDYYNINDFNANADVIDRKLFEANAHVGDIVIQGYRTNNPDYLLCDGTLLPPAGYPELFDKISYDYTTEWGVYWEAGSLGAYNVTIKSNCWSPALKLFVAVGQNSSTSNGCIYTSPDGKTWINQLEVPVSFSGVCWSPEKGMFLAVATDDVGSIYFYTSEDGITWTESFSSYSRYTTSAVCWSAKNNTFVVFGRINYSSQMTAFCTSDGTDVEEMVDVGDWNTYITTVCWSPELEIFVAAGYNMPCSSVFFTSPDGIEWNLEEESADDSQINSVCWSAEWETFVAVGKETTGSMYPVVYQSEDGIAWSRNPSYNLGTRPYTCLNSVCWSSEKDKFMAVGYDSYEGPVFVESTDGGYSWDRQRANSTSINNETLTICWAPEIETYSAMGDTKSIYSPNVCYYSQDESLFALPSYNNGMKYTYIRAKESEE